MKKKYDVQFVEIPAFESDEEAMKVLNREEKKFTLNIIATVLALLGTFLFLVSQNEAFDFLFKGVLEYISFGIYAAGLLGTIALNPIKTFKSVIKVAKFGYNIVPFILFDLIGGAIFFGVGLIGLFYVPVAYAAYNLYDSYRTKKEANLFLATA